MVLSRHPPPHPYSVEKCFVLMGLPAGYRAKIFLSLDLAADSSLVRTYGLNLPYPNRYSPFLLNATDWGLEQLCALGVKSFAKGGGLKQLKAHG